MSRPLARAQHAVDSRLRQLHQNLNNELGFRDQRLRFTKSRMRSGSTFWRLRNNHVEGAGTVMPQGAVAELATAANDESILYFGYSEEWQPASGRDRIEFISSNLRFIIASIDDMPDLHFRLEWAGANTKDGTVAYPGVGAAHPHWQFDVDAGWIDRVSPAAAGGEAETFEIDLEPTAENVDLDDFESVGQLEPPRISATLASFHRLHLPARTMWHDLLCAMPDVATPHQHTPESEQHIDRWVISALRYLRSEYQTYL